MGGDDMFDDNELGNLPPEAFGPFDGPFDPDSFWLSRADEEDQITAMREWFLARYCDPVHGTPYSTADGGYLFIWGGPYDPATELLKRFSNEVDEAIILRLVDDLHATGGDEWAPRDTRPRDYYDDNYGVVVPDSLDPLRYLHQRLEQTKAVLTLKGNPSTLALVDRLAFSSAITALESFLWETLVYWVDNDSSTVTNLITALPVFNEQKILLRDIYKKLASLKDDVKAHLQNMVWHRWDQVSPVLKWGLKIAPPASVSLMCPC